VSRSSFPASWSSPGRRASSATCREPYREDTSIRGESVRVEREGEHLASFALTNARRVCADLLTGFSSLLDGDASG
jgi:hypothetical protein